MTFRVGTHFVREAVLKEGGTFPENIRKPDTYPQISRQTPIEVIFAISGKALLLVETAEIGRKIVAHVTEQALRQAPGLEVGGVVGPGFDLQDKPIHLEVTRVYREYEAVRSRLPSAMTRFGRLPIVAECASSGLPASRRDGSGRDAELISPVSHVKRQYADEGLKRIQQVVRNKYKLPATTDQLERIGRDWLAIVHADGNGLGQVFLDFETKIQANKNRDDIAKLQTLTEKNRDYITKLRAFSLALDKCTEQAFVESLAVFETRRGVVPIVPLILGGDDLTVVCDGRQSLHFTKGFIDRFVWETWKDEAVKAVMPKGVTSCAGIAIIKPHFPFFAGYELAENLLKEAKKIAKQDEQGNERQQALSAIDYHILYDASGSDLERIRAVLQVDDEETNRVGRPENKEKPS